MKVVCEYCGSYVEADENMKCPSCLAELGSSVQAEQERIAKEEEAEQARQTEEKAQEAKEEHVSEIIQGIAGVATAVVTGVTASSAAKNADDFRDRPPLPPDERRGMHRRTSEAEGAGWPAHLDDGDGRNARGAARPAKHERMRASDSGGHEGPGGMRPGSHEGPGGGMRPGSHRR